jgi:hypothetical protein
MQPPLALGLLYPAGRVADPDALISLMNRGIAQCGARRDYDYEISPSAEPFRIAV